MDKHIGLSVLTYFYKKLLLQIKEKTTFEVDLDGNIMPKENPFATADWDVDDNNNLMPNILKE
jgi:hypothetical protein